MTDGHAGSGEARPAEYFEEYPFLEFAPGAPLVPPTRMPHSSGPARHVLEFRLAPGLHAQLISRPLDEPRLSVRLCVQKASFASSVSPSLPTPYGVSCTPTSPPLLVPLSRPTPAF